MGLGLGLGAAAILWLADLLSLDRQRRRSRTWSHLRRPRRGDRAPRRPHGMLNNDPEGGARPIANITEHEPVERLRIYNKEGRIGVSSEPAGKGTRVDKRSEECIECHPAEQPKSRPSERTRIRKVPAAGGGGLGIITPIDNEPKCSRLPRAPCLPARPRHPRREAVDGPGGRRPRRSGGRCSTASSPPASRCSS